MNNNLANLYEFLCERNLTSEAEMLNGIIKESLTLSSLYSKEPDLSSGKDTGKWKELLRKVDEEKYAEEIIMRELASGLASKFSEITSDPLYEEKEPSEKRLAISSLYKLKSEAGFDSKKDGLIALSSISGHDNGIQKRAIFKRLLKTLPFAGLVISGTLLGKNIIEAYRNAKKIIDELNFEKYGLSRASILVPTVAGIYTFRSQIILAIKKFKDSYSDLEEILKIFKIVKTYCIDLFFVITNGVSLVLDAISVLALLGATLPTGVTQLIGGAWYVVEVLLSIGLMGGEYAAEKINEKIWEGPKELIREIANRNIAAQ
jgi:hypothetical protein